MAARTHCAQRPGREGPAAGGGGAPSRPLCAPQIAPPARWETKPTRTSAERAKTPQTFPAGREGRKGRFGRELTPGLNFSPGGTGPRPPARLGVIAGQVRGVWHLRGPARLGSAPLSPKSGSEPRSPAPSPPGFPARGSGDPPVFFGGEAWPGRGGNPTSLRFVFLFVCCFFIYLFI